MVAVDTNIIIRLFTRDDPKQLQKSIQLFNDEEIFIPDTVIMETEWVLRFAYGYDKAGIVDALSNLFGLPNVHLSDAQRISLVLAWYEGGLGFADAFHLASSQDLSVLKTFDQDFIKKSINVSNCKVELP